jgi:hypothetical protein
MRKEPLSSDLNGPDGRRNPAFLPNIVDLNTGFGPPPRGAKTSPAPSPLVVAPGAMAPAQRDCRPAGCPYLLWTSGALPRKWAKSRGQKLKTPSPRKIRLDELGAARWRYLASGPCQSVLRPILLGLPAGINALATCRLQNLQRCGIRASAIRPRWEAQPDIWRKLLHAAIGPRSDSSSCGWGLQLMAVTCPPTAGPQPPA